MSWRVVVVSSNAKVDYKMDYIVVRTTEEIKRVHISEISVLMLESTAISITAYAMCELLKQKVKLIICDHQRNPCGELMALNDGYDSAGKIRRQLQWSDAARQLVWTEIVREKIRGQREVLSAQNLPQAALLDGYLAELQLNDVSNREGHAAKVYFNALFGRDFSRADDNLINAALNYGYSLILSAINREITAAGYLTQLGICHDNTFNAFNLGCDFMEPLRPLIDNAVLKMRLVEFEHEEKMQLVRLLNEKVYIDGQAQYLTAALRLYCKSLFRALESGSTEEIRFIRYEL